ncbi:MAG: ABC transporter permease, partial [Candidatus Hodarchaeota archaeon]
TPILVLGVDSNFKDVSFLPDHFFKNSVKNDVFSSLLIPNQILISNDLAKDYDFQYGDIIGETSFKVSAIAYNFPTPDRLLIFGLDVAVSTTAGGTGIYFIVTSQETFESFFGTMNASYFLIKTSMSPVILKNQIINDYGPTLDILTSNEILDTLEKPGISNFNGVLSIEFIVVIIIACLGTGIFLLTTTQQRKQEIGTLFSLGATVRHIGTFIIGEAITATVFSVSIGSIIGFLVSILFRGFRSEPGSIASPVTFSFIGFILLLFFVIVGIVLAVFISILEVKKTSVSEVLRTI